jgi:hypothetical protein
MNKKYRPPNGTEGSIFIARYCAHCEHEKYFHTLNDNDKKCPILSATFIFDIDDPNDPSEWQYNEKGEAFCSNFKPF